MKIPFDPRLQILSLINAIQMTDPVARQTLVEQFFSDVREHKMPLLAISQFTGFTVSDGLFSIGLKSYRVKGNAQIRTFSYFHTVSRECISVTVKTQGEKNTFLDFTHALPEGCDVRLLDLVAG
ncbi:hypothetical protein H7X65_01570 [Candidatus Parcubacteria bacterium]|nr:hypothetical protein [Candidatus Parcubacteria bacterium]